MVKKQISTRRVIVTSFLVDLSDLIFNSTIAILSGSVVMISEALQGGADLLASGLLLVGLSHSNRRSSKEYRFGYGREMFFWVLMTGVSMFVLTGTLSIYFGIHRILDPAPIHNLGLAYLALGLGLLTNGYALQLSWRRMHGWHVGRRVWRRLRHSSQIETKATIILDLMGVLASALGLVTLTVYAYTGLVWVDGVGSILIGLVTSVLAVVLISSVKDLLVGRSATSDIEERIRKAALEVTGVRSILDLRTMYLGSERLLVNIEVHMMAGLETEEIEKLIDAIKSRVKKRAPIVSHIQVELETPSVRKERTATPTDLSS